MSDNDRQKGGMVNDTLKSIASMASGLGSIASNLSYASSLGGSALSLHNRNLQSYLSFRENAGTDELLDSMNPLARAIFLTLSKIRVSNVMLFINFFNTIILALQSTSVNKSSGWTFALIDSVLLGIYMAECILKIGVFGVTYFNSSWNIFDFCVVLLSIGSSLLQMYLHEILHVNAQIFRLFRIFRVFRALRGLKALRRVKYFSSLLSVLKTLTASLPAMANIITLAIIVFFVFGLIARTLYAATDPGRFGTLGTTFFRLFALVTFDEWYYMVEKSESNGSQTIFLFVFVYIMIETFIFINLFTAVLVNNLQQRRSRRHTATEKDETQGYQNIGAYRGGGFRTAANIDQSDYPVDNLNEGTVAMDELQKLRQEVDQLLGSKTNLVGESNSSDIIAGKIKTYYQPETERIGELFSSYYQLLAALEMNILSYQAKTQVLENLIDLGIDQEEEEEQG